MTEEHLDALPIGAMVQEYKILRILGAGGFGITYLGIDTHTDMKVAIKEYFPSFSAVRRESTVLPKSTSDKDEYDWGLRSFLDEAKTVASGFPNHPNIVQVLRYIPANNTAYIIMRYEDGEPLDKILRTETLTEEELLHNILLPLLDGLGKVHAAGFLHRDIKPGNIYMRRSDESPVLLDFGAARNAAAYGAAGREMTHIETEGYAPIEQSVSEEDNVAGWHQGAWSDIYALGVVAYRIIANELPPKSRVRSLTLLTKQKDPLKPAVEVGKGRFSETVLKAIDHALAFAPEDRPQNCEEWRRELTAQTAAEPVTKPEKPSHHQKEKVKPSEESTGTNSGKHKEPSEAEMLPKKKGNTLKVFVGVVVLIIIVGVIVVRPTAFFAYKDSSKLKEACLEKLTKNAYPITPDDLSVDLNCGTVNGVSPDYKREFIKSKLPFFDGETPYGEVWNYGGGVFYNKELLYFYDHAKRIEVRNGYLGTFVPENISEIEGWVKQSNGDYETHFGCARINSRGGKIIAADLSRLPCPFKERFSLTHEPSYEMCVNIEKKNKFTDENINGCKQYSELLRKYDMNFLWYGLLGKVSPEHLLSFIDSIDLNDKANYFEYSNIGHIYALIGDTKRAELFYKECINKLVSKGSTKEKVLKLLRKDFNVLSKLYGESYFSYFKELQW